MPNYRTLKRKTIAFLFFLLIVVYFIIGKLKETQRKIPETGKLKLAINDEGQNLHLTDGRIFSHEASGRPFLTWRELCSLEAAARYHPSKPVQLFMSTNTIDFSLHQWKGVLDNYPNIQIIQIENSEYFKGTPLAEWYESKRWEFSEFEITHMKQYLKMVTQWKGGGQYLDLDVIIFKTLDDHVFRDYILVDANSNTVDDAVFHLSQNHPLIEKLMYEMTESYDPLEDEFESSVVRKVLKSYCGKSTDGQYISCSDVRLFSYEKLPHYHFHPNGWSLPDSVNETQALPSFKEHYGMHKMYNPSINFVQYLKTDALFKRLTKTHCPHTVKTALKIDDV